MIKKFFNTEFFRYLVAGGIVTVVNWLIYSALVSFVPQISWRISNFCAIFLSILLAYALNRRFIFRSKKPVLTELILFFLSRGLISLIFEHGFMELMIGVFDFNPVIDISGFRFQAIKVFAAVFVVLGNYFVGKYVVFKQQSNKEIEQGEKHV